MLGKHPTTQPYAQWETSPPNKMGTPMTLVRHLTSKGLPFQEHTFTLGNCPSTRSGFYLVYMEPHRQRSWSEKGKEGARPWAGSCYVFSYACLGLDSEVPYPLNGCLVVPLNI